nr:MAG TPA: Protein of unknown function (DUF2689) [Bacteriophage sp.]
MRLFGGLSRGILRLLINPLPLVQPSMDPVLSNCTMKILC